MLHELSFSQGDERTTYGLLLSSSSWHYKNLGVSFCEMGDEKKNPFVGFISSHSRSKKSEILLQKKNWSKHVWS